MKHFLGIDDEEFLRGKAPMTKREVRILTLAEAHIQETDIVCDIGAGTGSLSIEAALLATQGHVYAIERKAEAIALLHQNQEKFRAKNLTIIEGEAPKAMRTLPAHLDVALIGGTGNHLEAILDEVGTRLVEGGRIIVNCITAQTLTDTLRYFRVHAEYQTHAEGLQVTRWKRVGPYDMADALNPVHIIAAEKQSLKEEEDYA